MNRIFERLKYDNDLLRNPWFINDPRSIFRLIWPKNLLKNKQLNFNCINWTSTQTSSYIPNFKALWWLLRKLWWKHCCKMTQIAFFPAPGGTPWPVKKKFVGIESQSIFHLIEDLYVHHHTKFHSSKLTIKEIMT